MNFDDVMVPPPARGAPAPTLTKDEKFALGVELAEQLLEMCPGLEPTSAIRQAGSDAGIPWGDEMGAFCAHARRMLGYSR